MYEVSMFYSYKISIFFLICLFMLPVIAFSQIRELGNLLSDGIPDIPSRIIERMNQYQNIRSASFLDWNPYGPGMLITTRFGETNQIHFVEFPGASRQQITFFHEPVSSAQYYPKKDRNGFLFSMDTGGGEFYQLFYFDLQTGKKLLLTDGKSRNTAARFSHDGKGIIFSSNLRNGKDMVYVFYLSIRRQEFRKSFWKPKASGKP